ncbi:MAG TPA: ABC-type transport auxiliary lipoprotein family protein [Rhodanobacteraceae bacterium]|nr:ABC-type transport auxiliary lipoprotein family protein [Rhodanobacteraceae bacterium]
MKALTPLLVLCSLALLAGCSSILPKGSSFDVYELPAGAASATAGPAVAWQLRVDTPQAQRVLSGTRIVVQPEPGKVSTYQNGRWVQRAPQLLRDRLIEAFHASGRIHGISSDEADLAADFELDSTLAAFQAEYRGQPTPTVVVRLDARLLKAGGRQILASRRFSIEERTDGTKLDAVVAAFGRACDRLSQQIVAWTLAQGQKHAPPPAAP